MIGTDYIFGKMRSAQAGTTANLFIGNMGIAIPSAASLANKFLTIVSNPEEQGGSTLQESDIKYFNIVGNDIEAKIEIDVKIKDSAFTGSGITYIRDMDGYIKNAWTRAFFNTDLLKEVHLPGLQYSAGYMFAETEILPYLYLPSLLKIDEYFGTGGGRGSRFVDDSLVKIVDLPSLVNLQAQFAFYHDGSSRKMQENVYMPALRNIRLSSGNDQTFTGIKAGSKYYFDPFLQTANAGAEEPDITHIRNQGGTVVYIQNFTPPANITNLAHSGGGVLTFTSPSSTNALDQYLVYKNGLYIQKISTSGATVSGLVSGDKIKIKPYDIYFNRSESNEITI